jgi:hypothetical protein
MGISISIRAHYRLYYTGRVGCTNRISVEINNRIITEDLSAINEGIPLGYIDQ